MSKSPGATACELCGRPDAIKIDDRFICQECYENAGSCCPEFGADDLWEFDQEETSRKDNFPREKQRQELE